MNARKLGMAFERKVEALLQKQGYETCTPRSTARVLGRGFAIHTDFFGLFDGIAQLHWTNNGNAEALGVPKRIWWQCKRNWLDFAHQKKGRDIKAGVRGFERLQYEEKRIYYLNEGQICFEAIP